MMQPPRNLNQGTARETSLHDYLGGTLAERMRALTRYVAWPRGAGTVWVLDSPGLPASLVDGVEQGMAVPEVGHLLHSLSRV